MSNTNDFTILYEGADGKLHEVPASESIALALEEFAREKARQKKEGQRHGDGTEHEKVLAVRHVRLLADRPESVEAQAEADELRDDLLGAIGKLTVIQQRRVMMRYFMDMKLEDIAQREQVDLASIRDSLELALKRLKKLLGDNF